MAVSQRETCLSLMGPAVEIDLNAAGATEVALYTTPTGKIFFPTHVLLDNASISMTTADITLGIGGGSCDEFRGVQTLTGFDGTAGKYLVIYADQGTNDTPEGGIQLAAGESFSIEIETAQGAAATCDAAVIGILRDA